MFLRSERQQTNRVDTDTNPKNCFPLNLKREMASYEEIEDKTGIRLSWNAWPTSRVEAAKMVVPIAAMYTPLKETVPFQHEPVACKSCRGILNPCWLYLLTSQIDGRARTWTCALCFTRNQLPPHYGDISPGNMPPELMQVYKINRNICRLNIFSTNPQSILRYFYSFLIHV